jgi:small subunit ribosomal protein S16
LVKLRLRRMGKKKKPIYKIVAADARSPRDGKFIESVGYYNPNMDPIEIKLNEKKISYWIDNGAQPTHTVNSLFRREGIIFKRNLIKKGLDASAIEEKMNLFFENRKTKLDNEKVKKVRRRETKARKRKEAKNKTEK